MNLSLPRAWKRPSLSTVFRLFNITLCLLLCCCRGGIGYCAHADGDVFVTSPAAGAKVSSLPSISGTFSGDYRLSDIRVSLVRDRDGKMWDGQSWGGPNPTQLSLVSNSSGTWTTTTPMPAGSSLTNGLPEGYYAVRLEYPSVEAIATQPEYIPFVVGNPPPPAATVPYSWGYNGNGALGDGSYDSKNKPVPVITDEYLRHETLIAAVAGGEHVLGLTASGRVFGWGYNGMGQLGIEENGQHGYESVFFPYPVNIPASEVFIGIGAADYHSFGITREGSIYAWGYNDAGQLGTGSASPGSIPGPVKLPANFLPGGRLPVAIGGGIDYSLALANDGTLWSWGANANGQLGNGSNTASLTPVAVAGFSGKKIVSISAAHDHALALTSDGLLYAWGLGANGLLGTGSSASSNVPVRVGLTGGMAGKKIESMSASRYHSMAVTTEGKVFAWGANTYHGLGDGGVLATSNVPIAAGGPLSGRRTTLIAAGWSSSFALTSDGKLWAWGDNGNGNLCGAVDFGVSATTPTETNAAGQISPLVTPFSISTGWQHSILLTATGSGPVPDLVVETGGAELVNGSMLDLGIDAAGAVSSAEITLRNRGNADLTDLALTTTGTGFSAAALPATKLAPGQLMRVKISYSSTITGVNTGVLKLLSSDIANGVYNLNLTGTTRPYGSVEATSTFAHSDVTGVVNAMAVQADHRIVIGGSISSVSSTARTNLARVNANGTLDTSFTATANGPVNAIAIQRDGKILIGGNFTQVSGVARNKVARLLASGALDASFDPNVSSGVVNALHANADGSIFIGGSFDHVGSASSSFLVKVTASGAVDGSFHPAIGSQVRCMAVQDDGFVLIGGSFSSVGSASRIRLARLEPDGFPDPDFVADVTGGSVYAIVAQNDGRVVIGGDFTTVNGTSRNSIARLSTRGVVDTGFAASITNSQQDGPAGAVTSIARLANGRLLVTGSFNRANTLPVGNMTKLTESGSIDGSFSTGAGGQVNGVIVQDDGGILVGGSFSAIGGTVRNNFTRLTAENPVQTVDTITIPGQVDWIQGASFPETAQATLEVSTDNGATWNFYGNGVRLSSPQNGWRWFNASLPNGKLRLRASTRGGLNNGSGSVIETLATYAAPPMLQVALNGNVLADGSALTLNPTHTGVPNTTTLTLTNTGGTTLTGLYNIAVTGSTDFIALTPAADTLAPGASTTLTVEFLPRSTGDKIGLLGFPTNATNRLFSLSLKGTGALSIESWRQANFGSPENTGSGADLADPDGDGRTNLMEYATGTQPGLKDKDGSFFQVGNNVIYFFYQRSKAALADVTYQVEYSTDPAGPWIDDQVGDGLVYFDDGVIQMVQTIVPASTVPTRFARLRMSRNDP